MELSAQEAMFLLGLLKQHLEYYRLLAGMGHVTEKSLDKREFVEKLCGKLAKKEKR